MVADDPLWPPQRRPAKEKVCERPFTEIFTLQTQICFIFFELEKLFQYHLFAQRKSKLILSFSNKGKL